MSDPAHFLAAVRKAAVPGIWSNGVNLSRNGAVAVESRTDKELVLRVRAPGRPVAPTVVLYPQDESWECDCPSRVDPCEHWWRTGCCHVWVPSCFVEEALQGGRGTVAQVAL